MDSFQNDSMDNIILFSVKSTLRPGKAKVFYTSSSQFDAVAVVGLPKKGTGINEAEGLDEAKEGVREAAAGNFNDNFVRLCKFRCPHLKVKSYSPAGCRCLQADGIKNISVETFDDAEAAAEGSHLGVWKFQEFKTKKEDASIPEIVNYDKKSE